MTMHTYRLVIIFLIAFNCNSGYSKQADQQLEYILQRYLEAAGGSAEFEQLISMRITGSIDYSEGGSAEFMVIKKKPDLMRSMFDYGHYKVIQAYDGTTAWTMVDSKGTVRYRKLTEPETVQLRREAPLENPLINPRKGDYTIHLGEDTKVAGIPCYQVEVEYSDGWKSIYLIDKKSFRELRILQKNPEGELFDELSTTDFEFHGGVLFSKKVNRIGGIGRKSSLIINSIELNFGLVESVFSPPSELLQPVHE